jgi:class 3 adenylate cyclase/tetratricopeptide (TPR) repeat protein
MKCPRCEIDNREGLRFCEDCGSRLPGICPACGAQTSPAKKFCGVCGGVLPGDAPSSLNAPVAATIVARRPLESERKQVTVLFADMKGSMELLADLDPEEARKVLDPVLQLMMGAVHQYDGTVNQVMGDGIMALFGAPLAHEDHAVRACYAAVRMRDAVREYAGQLAPGVRGSVQIRVGLNSGHVVVRSIASDLQMDYTAVGQTTHLASRMEQMARPDTIMATRSCVRMAEGYVTVKALGRQTIKGLAEPLDLYEITGVSTARSRLDAAMRRGLSRFVGRDAELDQLHRALLTAAGGHGQVVAIVGEPGTGKSRLIYELARSDATRDWRFLATAATPYGQSTTYRPVTELLKSYFAIEDSDDHAAVRDRVAARLTALDSNLVRMLRVFVALLGLPDAGAEWQRLAASQRRRQTLEAIIGLLVQQSLDRPLCLVVEDLHWMDTETHAVLDELVETLPSARILLLLSYRPEFRHQWMGKTYYRQVRLDALASESAQKLLDDLLGLDGALRTFKDLVAEKTGGNPFFLEECVRAVIDAGGLTGAAGAYHLARPLQDIEMPATVQAVIAARIDRLAYEDKVVLETAAVIGKDVSFALLHAIADSSEETLRRSLRRLRAAEFLYETRLFPDIEYTFRHALTHEVAYGNLLGEKRRALHGRIVHALEKIASGRLVEHIEQLADHARNARLWDRAARYLRQAGAKAFSRSANHEAVRWLENALDALKRVPATNEIRAEMADVHLELRNALTLVGDHEQTLAHLREAQAIARQLADERRLGRALSFETNCLFLLGEHEAAINSGRQAHAIAERLGDVPLKTVTRMYMGRAYLRLGDFTGANELFADIVAGLTGPLAHEHLGLPVLPAVFARSLLVEGLASVGRFGESARHAEDAMALAEPTKHADTLFWAYHGLGLHHLTRGDARLAAEALERGYAICQTYGMPTHIPRITAELGFARALDGRAADSIPMIRRAAEDAASRKQAASYSIVQLLLGEVLFLAGRSLDARDAATRALELFLRQRERAHEASALRLLGVIAAHKLGAEAETHLAAARALAGELGMRPLGARCDLSLARLFHTQGRRDDAVTAYRAASVAFGELGMQGDLSRADEELRALS